MSAQAQTAASFAPSAPAKAEPRPLGLYLSETTIALVIALAVGLHLWRVIGWFEYYPGTKSDARFNLAILEHLWLWASGRAASLADPGFFYPFRDVLYMSDTHFGEGWIYAAFRALGASRETAFDLWYLAGMGATFAAALYAFRRLGLPGMAAAFAACVFAFSLPMLAQYTHPQFIYRAGVPLATVACIDFVRSRRPADLAALALWTSWQFLCSFYIGVFLCEWLVIVAVFAWFATRVQPPSPSVPKTFVLIVAAALTTALAAYMLYRHAEVARVYAIQRDPAEIQAFAPRLSGLLTMLGSPIVGWFAQLLPNDARCWAWEQQLFPGVGVVLLAGAGVWSVRAAPERCGVVALCLAATFGMLALYLDVQGYGLNHLLSGLPGFNAIRFTGRVSLVVAFPIAWLAGLGFAALRESRSQAGQALLLAGLALALTDIAGFVAYNSPVAENRERIAAISQGLDAEDLRSKRAVLVHFGPDEPEQYLIDLDLIFAAQERGATLINGYSGSDPRPFRRLLSCEQAKAWLKQAEALPHRQAGAEDLPARAIFAPPGACDK